MNLEIFELLTIGGEGIGCQHWSRNASRPRYSFTKQELKESSFAHRFTCFDVAERVEGYHDVLLAGRSDGALVLWRMMPRNLFGGANKNDRVEETLATSLPHKGAVTCVTHTHPGAYGSHGEALVFSGSTDHTVKSWNAWACPPSKESCLQTMAEHRGGVTALGFAGDGTLISTAREGSIRLWRPQRGRKLLRYPFFCCVKNLSTYAPLRGMMTRPRGAGQSGGFVGVWATAVCVAGGEEWTLYCGDSDGTVSVFQRTTASVAERVANAAKRIDNLTIQQLADSEVSLRRRWSHLHSLAVTSLVLIPEHNFLASMGNDGACRILDYLQGNIFMTIESEGRALFTSVAWDLAHEQLVVADDAGVVQIWNTYTGSLLFREQVAEAIRATGPRRGHASPALLGFHSSRTDGTLYGMSPAGNCFFRWKLVKVEGYVVVGHHHERIVGLGFQRHAFRGRRQPVHAGDGRSATTGDAPGNCEHESYRPLREGKELELCEASAYAQGAATKRDGDSERGATEEHPDQGANFGIAVLSASLDGTIMAWETVGKSEKYRMQHPLGEELTSMLVLPGGSILATGTDHGSVKFWRLETGAAESFKAHDNSVSALAACRDHQGSMMLASGGFDGKLVMWRTDLRDSVNRDRFPKVEVVTVGAHGTGDGSECEILCLAFVVADVTLLASAGNDFIVKCWSSSKNGCMLVTIMQGHMEPVEVLVADGLHLISADCDGTVRVWNVARFVVEENDCRGNAREAPGNTGVVSLATFIAHSKGVADMAIVVGEPNPAEAEVLTDKEAFMEDRMAHDEIGGVLATCGKMEPSVKLWDYTHVDSDQTCGRLLQEIRSPNKSLFTCIACTVHASGAPLFFAGSSDGSLLELAIEFNSRSKKSEHSLSSIAD